MANYIEKDGQVLVPDMEDFNFIYPGMWYLSEWELGELRLLYKMQKTFQSETILAPIEIQ